MLFDLTAMDDDQARRIRDLQYARDAEEIEKIIKCERPIFERINDLMYMAGLRVAIENSKGGEIVARHREATEPYSMAQLSDGERNAVILAANVFTVAQGIVLLIDEPERHLHRSIIEPLLSALFAERPDCPFVISTHEVGLPLANPEAPVLVVRSCSWNGDGAEAWDAKLLEVGADLPEDVKRAILGSRRRILFVEGTPNGLDELIYSALFPNISIIPIGYCDRVIDAVTGLRNSVELHDVEAFGLMDADNRSDDEIGELSQKGIYALNCYSVESVYYCSDAIWAVARRQAESLDENVDELIRRAQGGALAALKKKGQSETLAARRCERMVRQQVQLPTWKSILDNELCFVEVDTSTLHQEELKICNELLSVDDLEGIVARYPIRNTEAIEAIVKPLRLNRETYRKTLLSRIRQDPELADRLRSRIEPLSSLISTAD